VPEVEHIAAKTKGGDLTAWDNLLLGCKYCNTRKGIKVTTENVEKFLWPDRYNTALAYTYDYGVPKVHETLLETVDPSGDVLNKAQNLFELVKLDKSVVWAATDNKKALKVLEHTAAMIKRIAIREQNGEHTPVQIRTDKKPVSLLEQQLFIIESLPNIGPVNAKALLEHFGSVGNVINASEKDLQEVEGIGKKTAENIRSVIDSKYLYFKKEIKERKLL
jgi:hypothetical protein